MSYSIKDKSVEKPSYRYKELGVIETTKMKDKGILVCCENRCKQRFFEAREHQVSITKVICESKGKDVICYDLSKTPPNEITGFKYSFKGVPVIGYTGIFRTDVYIIPNQIYGNEGNGIVSRVQKVNGTDEYHLFDKYGDLIENWPPIG